MLNPTTDIIIVAAGKGRRLNGTKNKIFVEIEGIPIIVHTLKACTKDNLFRNVFLVVSDEDKPELMRTVNHHFPQNTFHYITGGDERFKSVQNGLTALNAADAPEMVFVHDGVRPFVTTKLIKNLHGAALNFDAAVPAVTPVETVRISKDSAFQTIDRDTVRLIQTPQVFKTALSDCFFRADRVSATKYTDEMSFLENNGHPFTVIEGLRKNIKITYPQDIALAEWYLKQQTGGANSKH